MPGERILSFVSGFRLNNKSIGGLMSLRFMFGIVAAETVCDDIVLVAVASAKHIPEIANAILHKIVVNFLMILIISNMV